MISNHQPKYSHPLDCRCFVDVGAGDWSAARGLQCAMPQISWTPDLAISTSCHGAGSLGGKERRQGFTVAGGTADRR